MLLPVFRFLFAIQMIDEIKAKHKRPPTDPPLPPLLPSLPGVFLKEVRLALGVRESPSGFSPSTSRHRNRMPHIAWFCVLAETRRCTAKCVR
jgi:hypothetical protein